MTNEDQYWQGNAALSHTDSQERIERAKAGLDVDQPEGRVWSRMYTSPAPRKDDRRLVTTAHQALTIWGEESAASGKGGPELAGLDRPAPREGFSHEEQVCILVYTTKGFVAAYEALRKAYCQGLRISHGEAETIEAFAETLEARLPFRSIPKKEADCAADLPIVTVPQGRVNR